MTVVLRRLVLAASAAAALAPPHSTVPHRRLQLRRPAMASSYDREAEAGVCSLSLMEAIEEAGMGRVVGECVDVTPGPGIMTQHWKAQVVAYKRGKAQKPRDIFVKALSKSHGGASPEARFAAETSGLEAIRATATLRAPAPLHAASFTVDDDDDGEAAFLLLEFVDFVPFGQSIPGAAPAPTPGSAATASLTPPSPQSRGRGSRRAARANACRAAAGRRVRVRDGDVPGDVGAVEHVVVAVRGEDAAAAAAATTPCYRAATRWYCGYRRLSTKNSSYLREGVSKSTWWSLW